MAHCYYQQRGGEDVSFEAESALLEARGHRVARLIRHNGDLTTDGIRDRARVAADTVWSRSGAAEVRREMARTRPDVAHFQNTFPQLSPSVYTACRDAGVPVVQSLRNYRLRCVNSYLYRDGAVCEDCISRRVAWPGVTHACYRGSRAQSAVVAAMLATHWARGTWDAVDVFVALTSFAREKLIEFGLPADRIVVKPNFVHPDPGSRDPAEVGGYLLFFGRLSPEKGVDVLIRAAAGVPEAHLVIAGDGPQAPDLKALANDRVTFVGQRSSDELPQLIRDARAVVVPSRWYETFGRVVVEAYACGTPVIASDIGALAEVVEDGVTGLLVRPGDVDALEGAIRRAVDDTAGFAAMGSTARATFEQRYTADANYGQLMAIYQRAANGS